MSAESIEVIQTLIKRIDGFEKRIDGFENIVRDAVGTEVSMAVAEALVSSNAQIDQLQKQLNLRTPNMTRSSTQWTNIMLE